LTRRIVVIGAGAAGTTAAIQARKTDRSSQVYLVTRENEPEYSRCGLPYAFSGIVPRLEALISHPPSFYESVNKITLVLGTECMKIILGRLVVPNSLQLMISSDSDIAFP